MASINAYLPPLLLVPGRKSLSKTLQKLPFSPTKEKQNRGTVVIKATGESSDSSTSLTIFKSVKNVWDRPEDRLGLVGLGFAAVVAIWASTNLITAIDKLPIFPNVLEVVGILFSAWFVYRYLLFKPDREELVQIVNKSVSDIFE